MDYLKMAREILAGLPAPKPPPPVVEPLTDYLIAARVLLDINRRVMEYQYYVTAHRIDPRAEVQSALIRDSGRKDEP